jgi:hypothetical protein
MCLVVTCALPTRMDPCKLGPLYGNRFQAAPDDPMRDVPGPLSPDLVVIMKAHRPASNPNPSDHDNTQIMLVPESKVYWSSCAFVGVLHAMVHGTLMLPS